MTNREIARAFNKLAAVMELHGEHAFKIKSYQQAYLLLRKWTEPLAEMSLEQLESLPGVGKAIAAKILELVGTGSLRTYQQYAEQTPQGVLELLDVPGIGPKKVRAVWKELGVESVGELYYACQENRLLELNGFGPKTQKDLAGRLSYYLQTRHQLLGEQARQIALEAMEQLQAQYPQTHLQWTGELRRDCPVVNKVELLWTVPAEFEHPEGDEWSIDEEAHALVWQREEAGRIILHLALPQHTGRRLWETTGAAAYVSALSAGLPLVEAPDEASYLQATGLPAHLPCFREELDWAAARQQGQGPLISEADIKGVIHAHSTWSDGVDSLQAMAEACRTRGYQYLVITDHSKAAFYANGLDAERVIEQHREIDRLNLGWSDFRIFKGIEADILSDGQLDYDEETLARFELIIASVHSNLRMEEEKAMSRLLRAVAHPRTHILGHPTGRLLLSRPGYPVDHRRLIEACAEHRVAIELNANPLRLDLDYTWIPYAMECGVQVAINPDAHAIRGLDDVSVGVRTARKGGLARGHCLNTLSSQELCQWLGI